MTRGHGPATGHWRVSIRAKVILAMVLAAVAPVLVVASTSYTRQRAEATGESLDRLDALAAAHLGQLERLIEADADVARLLAGDPEVRATLIERSRVSGDADLRALRGAVPRLVGITVYDAGGVVVASTDASLQRRVATAGYDPLDPDQLRGRIVVGRGADPGRLSAAEIQFSGTRRGVVVIETDGSDLVELVTDRRSLGETGEIALVQREPDGTATVLATDGIEATLSARIAPTGLGPSLLDAHAGRETRYADLADRDGIDQVAVVRVVPGSSWGVVVSADHREALASTTAFGRSLLLASAVAAALTVLVAALFSRLVSRPVRAITDTATAVASGDLSARTAVSTRDELGTLGRAVNVMTDSLVDAARAEAARTAELEALNRQLADQAEEIRAIVDSAAEGIVVTDADGRIREVNRAAEAILGWPRSQIDGRLLTSLLEYRGGDDRDGGLDLLERTLRNGSDGLEMRARRPDDMAVPILISLSRVEQPDGTSYTALIRDISERVAYETRLSHLATHDGLTGLPNRMRVVELLADDLHRHTHPAVLFVDLDQFKVVNDSLGHAAGDEVLREVAVRLDIAVGASGLAARFGGDEFVVLLHGPTDTFSATRVAERILEALSGSVDVGDGETFVSASIGVAVADGPPVTASDLIRDADLAMYQAKQRGRSRVEVFDTELRSRVQARHELDTELRKALDRRALDVFYQPVVDIRTGSYVAVEALLRWNHPQLGPISPETFIPVAEESGLILEVGEYVLDAACAQLARWRDRHPDRRLPVAVNLSARELMQADCADRIRHLLERHGVAPELLTVEITESVLVTDAATVIHNLALLRTLGVSIALDDFGTGYSSLTYLRDLPVDIVKIDRSFATELGGTADGVSIVSMVLSLGRDLGIDVVVEGIETADQLEGLRRVGGALAQGYLFARPQPAEKVEGLIWPAIVLA